MTSGSNHVAAYAVQPQNSRGRRHAEAEAEDRSPYQRDRDRVVHATAFRKLQYKTQVFVTREGDFYRTRLTHSLEVAQIARSIARRLRLDEDLTEALALAHDLGHPPFGHAGETGLNEAFAAFGGFDHNAQSFRVVTRLEHKYAAFDGLNLTWETLEGLAKHNGPLRAPPDYIGEYDREFALDLTRHPSAEAQVAAFADDGLRAKLFGFADVAGLPVVGDALAAAQALTGESKRIRNEMSRRIIHVLINDVVHESEARLAALAPKNADAVRDAESSVIGFSAPMAAANADIKRFLFAHMYRHWRVNRMTHKAQIVTRGLASLLLERPDLLPDEWRGHAGPGSTARAAEIVRDYVAGMTDRYAMEEYARLTDPAVPS
jgi:dGTPase